MGKETKKISLSRQKLKKIVKENELIFTKKGKRMKKLMMALSIVTLFALSGCCCKRKEAPKPPVKTTGKATAKKAVTKKATTKATPKGKKYSHVKLDNTEELFA